MRDQYTNKACSNRYTVQHGLYMRWKRTAQSQNLHHKKHMKDILRAYGGHMEDIRRTHEGHVQDIRMIYEGDLERKEIRMI